MYMHEFRLLNKQCRTRLSIKKHFSCQLRISARHCSQSTRYIYIYIYVCVL